MMENPAEPAAVKLPLLKLHQILDQRSRETFQIRGNPIKAVAKNKHVHL